MTLSLLLNTIGLLFDLIGFIGLYKLKIKPLRKVTNASSFKRVSGSEKPESMVNNLAREVNNSFNELKNNISINDKKSGKFFLIVVIGILFQVSSTIIQYPKVDFNSSAPIKNNLNQEIKINDNNSPALLTKPKITKDHVVIDSINTLMDDNISK